MTTKLGQEFDIQEYLQTDETDLSTFFKTCLEEDPGDGSLVRRAQAENTKARNVNKLRHHVSDRTPPATAHSRRQNATP